MSKLGIWPTIQSPVVPAHRLVISGTLIVFLLTYLTGNPEMKKF